RAVLDPVRSDVALGDAHGAIERSGVEALTDERDLLLLRRREQLLEVEQVARAQALGFARRDRRSVRGGLTLGVERQRLQGLALPAADPVGHIRVMHDARIVAIRSGRKLAGAAPG